MIGFAGLIRTGLIPGILTVPAVRYLRQLHLFLPEAVVLKRLSGKQKIIFRELFPPAPDTGSVGGVALCIIFSGIGGIELVSTGKLFEAAGEQIMEIRNHPFVNALSDGLLDERRFRYYLYQDSNYLKDYSEALVMLADSAPDRSSARILTMLSVDGVEFEKSMHRRFFYGDSSVETFPLSRAFSGYGKHLKDAASSAFHLGIAAVLPCFSVYRKTGLYIAENSSAANPYRGWIETYESQEFESQVEAVETMADKAFQICCNDYEVSRYFIKSCKFELGCWDDAWFFVS